MGSNLNFKNFGDGPPPDGSGWPPGNFPLTRQSSIYALTFDEFQSTVGGIGKDFGSMNMDELIKNIWSAEENQNIGSTIGVGGGGGQEGGGYLQRQGSLTLPRTLSLKTVEEVWRDMSKDASGGVGGGGGGDVGFGVPQRQPTLGEITLEEFLVRAGVVREEPQLPMKPNNVAFFGDLSPPVDNSLLGFGFQQQQGIRNPVLMNGGIVESSNQIGMQSNNLPLNVNGVRSVAPQLATHSPLRQQQQQQQQQQLILPKQTALTYATPLGIPSNGHLGSPRIPNGLVQSAALGVVGLGANGVSVMGGSPAVSSDGLSKSNGDTSSVSPVPYVFNGTLRGRKSAALEKVVERRQRRMIKNRESAARSRARKQAYTMELEAEVAKLKEENEELQKKQEEMMETQKNQVMEMMNQQNGAKRRCLRRTQTGPW